MKKSTEHIEQFKLPPSASGGIWIANMLNKDNNQHDISKPHKDDHFIIAFAFDGEYHFKIDFEDIILKSPFILCIEPNQVHQVIKVTNSVGWILGIEEFTLESEFQSFLLTNLSHPISLIDKEALIKNIDTILKLAFELQINANVFTNKSIQFLINSLFCLLFNESNNNIEKINSKEKRSYIIERSFQKLLKKKYKVWKSPSQYASELSISVSHLNDTIREITGLSVSIHIQNQNILEAKRLLYFTDLEVKEVAFQLGYDDSVYFGKLFKKISGYSPLEFRKKFRD